MRLRHRALLILTFVVTASNAHAFFDPPTLIPESPVAGQMVSVSVRGGECDAIIESPGYPQITQDGYSIRILFDTYHVSSGGVLCNFTVGTLVQAVGSYPAGSYTLQVDRTYIDFFGDRIVETLGITPFVATEAHAVPAVGKFGLTLLSGVVLCLGLLRRRHA